MCEEITHLLQQVHAGNESAREKLWRQVYEELRRAAGHLLQRERENHTWQTTDVVHEAISKMLTPDLLARTPNRRYLFAAATRVMRQTLVDHARKRNAAKRKGLSFDPEMDRFISAIETDNGFDLEALDKALAELEHQSPRQHEVVEYRFFGGLSNAQIAEVLAVSVGTVENDWRLARAKLYRRLKTVK